MKPLLPLSRRRALSLTAASLALPRAAGAVTAREIEWIDLLPRGVPYPEIVAEGEMDEINDTWIPVYDEHARLFNMDLEGAFIRMPGYVVPLDIDARGVKTFLLVPYVGACIHVPPPPANQLVYVETVEPWPHADLWAAVWVTGTMRTQLQSTNLGEIGYALDAVEMEHYLW